MKKLVLILFCLQSWGALAGEFPCVHLNIKIKNETQSICNLTKISVISGQILPAELENLPLSIPPNDRSDMLKASELLLQPVDLILTYQCGENKTIPLQSQKGLCARNAVVHGTVLSVQNLEGTVETSNGSYWDNRPGTITWVIKE